MLKNKNTHALSILFSSKLTSSMANLPLLPPSLPPFLPINYSTLNDDVNATHPHEVFPQIPSMNDATPAELSPSRVQLQVMTTRLSPTSTSTSIIWNLIPSVRGQTAHITHTIS